MSNKLRRYEILIPTRFNDGRKIPLRFVGAALNEIVARFDAVSHERRAVEGRWRDKDTLYHDNLSRIFVDVPDEPESRQWMSDFKARWKDKFEQLELWMVSYAIDRD